MNRIKHILLLLLLLSGIAGSAQSRYLIDVVCIGAERTYRVDGGANSDYVWTLTDPLGTLYTLPETVDTVKIVWNYPAGTGIYTLATTQHDSVTGCYSLIELGTIEVIDLPTAYAGPDVRMCLPNAYYLAGSAAANYSSVMWTTSGDGSFDDVALLHPTYSFGFNDILSGTVTLTLTAEGLGYSGSCPPAESSVTITLDDLLVLDSITPASCPAMEDGAVQYVVTGGTEPYTFTLTLLPYTQTNNTGLFENLAAGTYEYYIVDVDGCETHGFTTIGYLPSLSFNPIATPETTPGANDGTITFFDQQGGSGFYEYSIQGGAPGSWSTETKYLNLSPGTYIVCMRDSLAPLCFECKETEIKTDEPLTAQYDPKDVSCFGFNDGSITFYDPENGSGTYEYSIDGGSTWQTDPYFPGLIAGDYFLAIRDFFNPLNWEVLDMVTIYGPEPLYAETQPTNETLPGANDGSITVVNAAGGSGAGYLYQLQIGATIIRPWQPSPVFLGLAPGTYDVYVADASNTNCFIVLNETVLPAGALDAEVAFTPVTCFGANDGSITISNSTGGSGIYEYMLDGVLYDHPWQSDTIFLGLAPDTYSVMMRDANNISNVVPLDIVIITEPAELSAQVVFTDVTCLEKGTITVTNPQGGYGTYQYSRDGFNWQDANVFTGLDPAYYQVFMRDSANINCVKMVGEDWIENTCILSAQVDVDTITCYNAADGRIIITNPVGGGGNYSYSIDGGDNWQTSGFFSPLAPGPYTVMMRDNDVPGSETLLENVVLSNPIQIWAIPNIDNHETWPGANDGVITVNNPVGGSMTYEYMLESGGVMIRPWQLSNTFTGLAPGSYDVWIRDANNIDCFSLLGTYIILPGGTITAIPRPTNVDCFGSNNGSIIVENAAGGSGNFEYMLDGIKFDVTWQSSNEFNGLPPDTYEVWVRDANIPAHAVSLGFVTITEPAQLFALVEPEMIGCNSTEGSITFTNPTGGSGNYEFTITGGDPWQSSNYFGGLAAGLYYPAMRDPNAIDCEVAFAPETITMVDPIDISVVPGDARCDDPNGSLTVTATGGSGVFEYQLDSTSGVVRPWQPSPQFDNLWAGTYTLLVRDDTGCEVTYNQSVVINGIPGVVITDVDITHTSNNQPNGKIHIYANSTAMPIVYSLDTLAGWQSSPIFTGLAAGITYTAWAKDANGCIDSWEFTVGTIIIGEIIVSSERVTECVGETKPLVVTVIKLFENISSFRIQLTYDPVVMQYVGLGNLNNNLVRNLVTATEITPGVLEISYYDPEEVSIPDGELLLELMMKGITPGMTDLQWQWLECIVLSPVGPANVPVITVNVTAEVFANPDLIAYEDGKFCAGDSTILFAETTMEQIEYTWTHPRGIQHSGQTWNLGTLSVMDSGDYIVRAYRDQCYTLDTVNIVVYPAPEVFITYSDTICFGNPVVLDPGETFVQYEWSNGSTMPTIIAYEAGIYWLKVIDLNGCMAMDEAVLEPCIIEVLIPNAFTPNNDGLNDTFKPIFKGFEPANYRMDIYSKWGQLIYTTANLGEGWDGSINGDLVSPDTFVYVVSYEVPSYVLRMGLHSPITGRVSVIR